MIVNTPPHHRPQPKEQLAERLGETYGFVSELIDHKIERVKLAVAEKSALTVAKVLTAIVLTILGILTTIFGCIALAFLIAGADDFAIGFGIVTGVFLFLAILVLVLRRYLIVNPAVSRVISVFFSSPDSQK